jgi:hypothetical protein
MSFRLDYNSRFGGTLVTAAPIIICWVAGILIGFSYLAMPNYLFWTLLVLLIVVATIFSNFRIGYYLALLLIPVDMSQLSIILPDFSSYRVLYFPYFLPLSITLAAWLISKSWKQVQRGKTTPINGILIFMVIYMLTSLLWAPHFDLGCLLAVSLILNFSVFFLTRAVIIDEATLRRAAIVWIVMGLVASTGVILSQWYSYKYTEHLTSSISLIVKFDEIMNRPAGFGSVNNMGGLIVSSIFITMGMFMVSRGVAKKLSLFLLIVYQVAAVVITTSRGSLIGLVAGFVLFFVIHPSVENRIFKYVSISILLLFVTILVAKPSYIDRILIGFGYSGELYFSEAQQSSISSSTSSSSTDTQGLSSRFKWWKKAFQEMLNRDYKLLLGLGVGGFITYAGTVYTHSIPLSFFFDLGVMGAIIFIILAVILIYNFAHYLKHAKRTNSYYLFLSLVVAFAAEVGIHGLIDYDFYSYPAKMFWFPLSFVCAALNVVMSENPELGK